MWSGAVSLPSESELLEGIAEDRAVRAQRPRPRFPEEDYVDLADSLASVMGVMPPEELVGRHDVVVPGHYSSEEETREQAVRGVEEALTSYGRGSRVGHVVFGALRGRWRLRRDLKSYLDSSPSGVFEGMAEFVPTEVPHEYLYRETGEFTIAGTTRAFEARREYVYACDVPGCAGNIKVGA